MIHVRPTNGYIQQQLRRTLLTLIIAGSHALQGQSLQPEQVLDSARAHHPQIQAALARQQQARGKQLATKGAFDTTLESANRARLSGFWDGRYSDWQASRQLRSYGAKLYGNYRLSGGSFPIYEDGAFTNEVGELKVGLLVSLLRDRTTDARRFGEMDAALATTEAEIQAFITGIKVDRAALLAYWRWRTLGRQLEVYEELLGIAQERDKGLQTKVDNGARAAIELVENRQNIIRREELVTLSSRDFQRAANTLSLFYRGADGATTVPHRTQLPAAPTPGAHLARPPDTQLDMATLIAARPELQALETAIERVRREIELRQNDLRPRLDLGVELGRDLGAVAEGGPSRTGTDTIVSLNFRLPLQRRAAKGRLAQSEARLAELRENTRLLTDQLETELQNLLLELTTTRRLVDLLVREVEQAEMLSQAEEKRFASGASDFFLVNLREQAAADALIRYHNARFSEVAAQINYDAALLNLGNLPLASRR